MSNKPGEILASYFPDETVDQVLSILNRSSVRLKITRSRRSKLGDYRVIPGQPKALITINGNIGKYTTYLVFLHELAHHQVRNKYGRSVLPHGRQWKEEFSSLLRQALFLGMFPETIKNQVYRFSLNVKATLGGDQEFHHALKLIDGKHVDEITVEDIPINTLFVAANGRLFQKEEKLRKRIRCLCITNQRRYLFHPAAVVKPVDNSEVKVNQV
jgi:SprT protein